MLAAATRGITHRRPPIRRTARPWSSARTPPSPPQRRTTRPPRPRHPSASSLRRSLRYPPTPPPLRRCSPSSAAGREATGLASPLAAPLRELKALGSVDLAGGETERGTSQYAVAGLRGAAVALLPRRGRRG
uniref:Uncharacterized protein n=1 Tax=Arundo donax TaxID=35708 RepID=A0A0A9GLL0_ARUDO